MLAPESVLNEHYRITYLIEDRPDSRMYRAIDQRGSLRVLIAELPQPSEAALSDVRTLAGQITGVTLPGLLTLRDHFAQGMSYFLVADDAGGQDLERVARDRGGPLPEDEVLTMTDRLLVALDGLHSRSPALYLGDLRATDLWSSPDGGLFLAPFALARHIGGEASPYRAPELGDANAEPTSSGDIYALGAVLYQLLTGWAPPTAAQRQAGTPLNSPRALNTRSSALAEQLVLRAMELKPANRYQRAGEMRSALETVRLMAGRSLGATAPVITEQLRTVGPASPPPPRPIPPASEAQGPPPPAPPQPVATSAYPPPYPPQQYATPGAPAAPAPRQGFHLSTGCLVALVAVLAVIALAVCVAGAWVGYVIFTTSAAPSLPGLATATVAPATAATAPAAAPAAGVSLSQGATFTETRQLREDAVGAAVYSPEGSLLAVGLGTNIQLRRGDELEPGATLSGHSGEISSLAFSPDGTILASGAQDDNSIRLWDTASGEELRSLEGHAGWIRSLAFSPDGRLIASGSTDLTVRLWDAASGDAVAVLEGHTDWLGNVAFSPDGATLASASRDGTVRLWDVAAGTARSGFSYTAPANPADDGAPFWLTGLAYSPDGRTLAAGSTSGSVYLLDAASGNLQRELTGHAGWITIRGVAYSPDGRTLASASLDGSIRLWGPGSGVSLGVLEQRSLRLLGLSWNPDGARIVVTSDTAGNLAIWNVQRREIERSLDLAQGAVTALAYDGGGELLATGGAGGTVRLHALASDQSTNLSGGAPTTQYVGFLGPSRLAAVSAAGEVVVIDLSRQTENRQLEGLDGFALNLVISRDQRLIAAGNERGDVAIWDTESFALQRTLRGLGGAVAALAFNSDATRIAAATNQTGEQPTLLVWDVQSGDRKATVQGPVGAITAVDMPAGASLVASSGSDGSLRLWNADDGSEVRSISADPAEGWFTSFAFSPDGSLLATGSLGGTVEFWNPQSGEQLARIDLASGTVLAMTFRGDGGQVAVSTRDGGVFLLEPVG